MIEKLFFLKRGNTPRWIIFFIDLGIVLFSIVLSYLLRFNFKIPHSEILNFRHVIPIVLLITAGRNVLKMFLIRSAFLMPETMV